MYDKLELFFNDVNDVNDVCENDGLLVTIQDGDSSHVKLTVKNKDKSLGCHLTKKEALELASQLFRNICDLY